jgi:4-diphosphocytidyl-2C-methyl-D-erythritol kinase
MTRVVTKSFGKITLYLDIVEPYSNRFWDIQSIVLPVDLFDTLHISLVNERQISVECDNPLVPSGSQNIVYKAVEVALEAASWFSGGVQIFIQKGIPPSSGLGGGSSNVATTLLALNALLNINWALDTVARKAIAISRDAYFFTYRKASYVGGKADFLVPLPQPVESLKCAIIDPGIPFIDSKSRLVMGRVKRGNTRNDSLLQRFAFAYAKADLLELRSLSYNFISRQLVPEYEKAFELRRELSKKGINVQFSGTGPFWVYIYKEYPPDDLAEVCQRLGAKIRHLNVME